MFKPLVLYAALFWLIVPAMAAPAQTTEKSYLVRGNWKLGVSTRDLPDRGVEVIRVSRDSAAERAGIRRGDFILTVNGSPVGKFRGRDYDLSDVVNSRADSYGRVVLVVHIRKTGRLESLAVQLDSSGNQWPPNRPTIPPITDRPSTRPPDYRPPGNRPPNIWPPNDRPNNQPGYRPWPPTYPPSSGWPSYGSSRYVAEINRLYIKFVGRKPKSEELQGWLNELAQGSNLSEVRVGLLSSSEFYDLCRNDRRVYVRSVFLILLNRQPTEREMAQWRERFEREYRKDRVQFARELMKAYDEY